MKAAREVIIRDVICIHVVGVGGEVILNEMHVMQIILRLFNVF